MRIFVCTDHDCFWPVGVASVVVAKNSMEAARLLDEALVEKGLKPYDQKSYELKEISKTYPFAYVLNDGNY